MVGETGLGRFDLFRVFLFGLKHDHRHRRRGGRRVLVIADDD